MRKFTFAILAISILLISPVHAGRDHIILVQGQEIIGSILAQTDRSLIVDIGIDVLVIDKDDVAEFHRGRQLEELDRAEVESRPGRLYYTSQGRPNTTIEECVQAFGQAVVMVSTPAGTGSGFFINENGYLITNYHVIERETRIEITVFVERDNGFERLRYRDVKIEAINPFFDLALLRVEDLDGHKTTYVHFADMDRLRVGQRVFAIGSPLGLERTVTDGVISTTARNFEGLAYLQTNADINPGNSGGPLFNMAGEVVGVTNMGYIFYGGLGFAIPIDYVSHFIDTRDAFAYDMDNPNSGFRYVQPPRRQSTELPDFFDRD